MTLPHEHESLADQYLATILRVEVDGAWVNANSAALALGPFHVITAWNPGTARPSETDNRAANQLLHDQLVALDCKLLAAIGSVPCSSHFEESWCVTGLTDTQARVIGADFGQWAVFRISVDEQAVLGCFGDWVRGSATPRNGLS